MAGERYAHLYVVETSGKEESVVIFSNGARMKRPLSVKSLEGVFVSKHDPFEGTTSENLDQSTSASSKTIFAEKYVGRFLKFGENRE